MNKLYKLIITSTTLAILSGCGENTTQIYNPTNKSTESVYSEKIVSQAELTSFLNQEKVGEYSDALEFVINDAYQEIYGGREIPKELTITYLAPSEMSTLMGSENARAAIIGSDIYVRNDLPPHENIAAIGHELGHNEDNNVVRENKAEYTAEINRYLMLEKTYTKTFNETNITGMEELFKDITKYQGWVDEYYQARIFVMGRIFEGYNLEEINQDIHAHSLESLQAESDYYSKIGWENISSRTFYFGALDGFVDNILNNGFVTPADLQISNENLANWLDENYYLP